MNSSPVYAYRNWLPAGLGAAVVATGCASAIVQSVPVSDNKRPQVGLVYALPKAQLRFVAQRKQVDAEEVAAAAKAAADAAAALGLAQKREAEAKSRAKDTADAEAADDGKNADVKPLLAKAAGIARAWLSVATQRRVAAEAAASVARTNHDALKGNLGKWVETATLTFLPSIPDSQARFIAAHERHSARDDAIKMTVANGMLSSSNISSTDQSATVILNLVKAAAVGRASGTKVYSGVDAPLIDGKRVAQTCMPFYVAHTFDPTVKHELAAAVVLLRTKSGGAMILSIDESAPHACARNCVGRERQDAGSEHSPADESYVGYVYRAARSVSASIQPRSIVGVCSAGESASGVHVSAVVPDADTRFVLPATAAAFVKSKLEYVFKDGMPTEVSIDQPSTLAAISGLPLEIAKAIIEVPASIIKLRVDYESQSAALAEAKTKLLKAQLDLQKAQDALNAEND